MFRNYLVTALRNIARHKLYSFINIAGLAVGLACAIFIILFVRDELSYDKWIPGSENLYRVEVHLSCARPVRSVMADQLHLPRCPAAMRDQIPEVNAAIPISGAASMTVTIGRPPISRTMWTWSIPISSRSSGCR